MTDTLTGILAAFFDEEDHALTQRVMCDYLEEFSPTPIKDRAWLVLTAVRVRELYVSNLGDLLPFARARRKPLRSLFYYALGGGRHLAVPVALAAPHLKGLPRTYVTARSLRCSDQVADHDWAVWEAKDLFS